MLLSYSPRISFCSAAAGSASRRVGCLLPPFKYFSIMLPVVRTALLPPARPSRRAGCFTEGGNLLYCEVPAKLALFASTPPWLVLAYCIPVTQCMPFTTAYPSSVLQCVPQLGILVELWILP